MRQGLEGERGVVEGAECRVHDDQDGGSQRAGQVGDRCAFVVVPHEQAAGALDEDEVAVGGELGDPLGAGVQVERRQLGVPGGGGGGERVGEAGVLVEVGDGSEPAYVGKVAGLVGAHTGLGRLHHRHP